MPKTARQIIFEINKMKIASGDISGYDLDAYEDYINKELRGEKVDTDSKVGQQIRNLMMKNPQIRKDLKESLPQTDNARKTYMHDLRTVASLSGWDKFRKDFGGAKRKAARRELQEIAEAKRKTLNKSKLNKDANKSISTGRGRRYFTWITNKFGLGNYDERHDEKKLHSFTKECKHTEINYRTPDGRLNGAYFTPDEPNPSGKVVLFFSGSGSTAEEYSTNAVLEYKKQGIPVVTMNYRGFGKSETLNKRGGHKGTPLSEESIYKDGKEMLKYVTDELHVKPENIILHGYSLGGAVASKVAADFAQEQQKIALKEGRNPKKLGGVVLQSSIKSMWKAGHAQIYEAFKSIPYVGGFLAATLGHALGAFSATEAKMHSGSYDTQAHMRRLHKFDPDIPVHYVSGTYDAGDDLALDQTNLHADRKAQFETSSVHTSEYDHENNKIDVDDEVLNQMLTTSRNDIVKKPQPEGPQL